jgi:hypothetical protein
MNQVSPSTRQRQGLLGTEKGIQRGRAVPAAAASRGTPIFVSLLRALVLALIVGTLIMVGLPAVLALGAAAT